MGIDLSDIDFDNLDCGSGCVAGGIRSIYVTDRCNIAEIPFTLSSVEGSIGVIFYEVESIEEDLRKVFKISVNYKDVDLPNLFPKYARNKYWDCFHHMNIKIARDIVNQSTSSLRYKKRLIQKVCKSFGLTLSEFNQFKYKKETNFLDRFMCSNLSINNTPIVSVSVNGDSFIFETNTSPSFNDGVNFIDKNVFILNNDSKQ